MELKKLTYFPYLPNSRIEDNKRYKYIRDMMEKNPFTFHRRKNAFSFFDKKHFKIIDSKSDNIEKNNEINENSLNNNSQESLIFQKDHDKYINLYNNFMKKKTSTIESNAQNYLNYLINSKKKFQLINDTNNDNQNNNLINSKNNSNCNIESISNFNKSSNLNNLSNNNNNSTIPITNPIRGRKHFILGIKSPTEIIYFHLGEVLVIKIFLNLKKKKKEKILSQVILKRKIVILQIHFFIMELQKK